MIKRLSKEPVLREPKYYYSNRDTISPNEYIKFQRETNVRNNWRRVHSPV